MPKGKNQEIVKFFLSSNPFQYPDFIGKQQRPGKIFLPDNSKNHLKDFMSRSVSCHAVCHVTQCVITHFWDL